MTTHGSKVSAESVLPPRSSLRIETRRLSPNGNFPNNPGLPVLIYRGGFPPMAVDELEESFRALFESNGWSGCWRSGIYDFHHYHSNAHEVLGACAGHALLELGGTDGAMVELWPGDVILLPAGTAHRKVSSTPDFEVLGAYPGGKGWNMRYGTKEELAEAPSQIGQVPLPNDPVFDGGGPVASHWKDRMNH